MACRYEESINNHLGAIYKEEDDASNHRKKYRMSEIANWSSLLH